MNKNGKKIETTVLVNMIQYVLLIMLGTFMMVYPEIGVMNPIFYVSTVFYIFSFITCLFYFIGRRKGDYENILLSLINVIVASYLFLLQDKTNTDILGVAISVYTILVIFNKMYSAYRLKSTDNIMWGMKYLTSLLLAFLGMLTMFNLFNERSVVTLMFGYYFIVFGIINFMEYLVEALVEFRGIKVFLKYIEEADVKKKPAKVAQKEEKKEEPEVKANADDKKVTTKTTKKETKEVKPEAKKETKKSAKNTTKTKKVVKSEKKVTDKETKSKSNKKTTNKTSKKTTK